MMADPTTYVDITTVRIHRYLERTPKLRLIRGASALLDAATDVEHVAAALTARYPKGCVSVCSEAGETASIIHLELACQCGSCEAEEVARWAVLWLREQVPAADFRATWGMGETYSAFATIRDDGTSAERGRLENPAPEAELSMLVPCDTCRRGYAQRAGRCRDCEERHHASNRRSKRSVESRLLKQLDVDPRSHGTIADFSELAALGPSVRFDGTDTTTERKTNHLATLYVDGNGFRAMFSGAGRHALSHGFDVGLLSVGIIQAVEDALFAAAAEVMKVHSELCGETSSQVPIIPHVVAADDLLVSLPAAYGWRFLLAYSREFAKAAHQAVDHAGRDWKASPGANRDDELFERVPPATASGSIVIAHASEPFASCLRAAESLLSDAKRSVSGRSATALWVDVSREGFAPPTSRRAIDLESFPEAVVAELAALPKSLRRNLEADRLVAGEEGRARLVQRARRLGLFNRNEHPAIADYLRTPNLDVARFADLVSISEWWS